MNQTNKPDGTTKNQDFFLMKQTNKPDETTKNQDFF
jgi:hypothetical protein